MTNRQDVAARLAGEVARLKADVATARSANTDLVRSAAIVRDELARFRDALPAIIGCAAGDPTTCTRDENGWYPCCRSRIAAVRHGRLPQPERHDEPGDGA